jgi:integrase
MASFKKVGGSWRVQVAIKGVRESGSFSTKAEAVSWAGEREAQIRKDAELGIIGKKTCKEVFDRYGKEVSIRKKNPRWEQTRLATLGEEIIGGIKFDDLLITQVTPDMLGQWRDKRMNIDKVSGSTVNRDFSLLSHVFTVARREWKWVAASPTTDVLRPQNSPARDRLISEDEIERIALASGFDECMVKQKKQRVGVAFLFAIETAMRAGEICGLQRGDINGSVATLNKTKNGTKRDVPLSARAIELLNFLPEPVPGESLFGVTAASLDALYRKIKEAAMIEGLTFHDTRHEAITRLARKLNVLELARMVGHRDLKMLQIYYNESASEIAKKL